MPIGLRNNAAAERTKANPSILRRCGSQERATSEPSRKSKKEQTRNVDANASPKKKDPWQLIHTANSGDNPKKPTRTAGTAELDQQQLYDEEEIADHLGSYGKTGGRK